MRVSISNPDPQHCRLNHRISTERVAQGAEFDIPRWASIVYITSSSWVRRRGYMRDSLYPKLIRYCILQLHMPDCTQEGRSIPTPQINNRKIGKVNRLHNRIEPFPALFWALDILLAHILQ